MFALIIAEFRIIHFRTLTCGKMSFISEINFKTKNMTIFPEAE